MPCPTCDDTRCVGPNLEVCPSCKDYYRTVAEVMELQTTKCMIGCCNRFADNMGCNCLSIAKAWEGRMHAGANMGAGRCKGCWTLGNNCGKCDHCKDTCHEALDIIKDLQKELRRWQKKDRIAELEAELAKLKEE